MLKIYHNPRCRKSREALELLKNKKLDYQIHYYLENRLTSNELKSIIEKNSGKILSSVNRKLNYLIVGDKPTSKKVNEASEMGIKIINQQELNKLLNKL